MIQALLLACVLGAGDSNMIVKPSPDWHKHAIVVVVKHETPIVVKQEPKAPEPKVVEVPVVVEVVPLAPKPPAAPPQPPPDYCPSGQCGLPVQGNCSGGACSGRRGWFRFR